MKIRSDYVTNSSSSSYVSVWIDSPILSKIAEVYSDAVVAQKGVNPDSIPYNVKGETFEISQGEDVFPVLETVPSEPLEAYESLCQALAEGFEYDGESRAPIAPLVAVLASRKNEIFDDIKSISWNYTNQGWGGDHLGRYDPGYFPEETRERIWQEIAEKNGYDISVRNQDDWNSYINEVC